MTHFHIDTIQHAYSSLAVTSTDTATTHSVHFTFGQRSRVTYAMRCSQSLRGAIQDLRDQMIISATAVERTCERWNQSALEARVIPQTSSVASDPS